MKFKVNKLKCAGCGACLNVCPYGAIKIRESGKAIIDQKKCKGCGKCQKICPFDAIEEISDGEKVEQQKPSAPTPIPYGPPVTRRQDLGIGRGFGRGIGRGLGRGEGRDGGGRGR